MTGTNQYLTVHGALDTALMYARVLSLFVDFTHEVIKNIERNDLMPGNIYVHAIALIVEGKKIGLICQQAVQRRSLGFEAHQAPGFVVRPAGRPPAPEDVYPLEGKDPYRHLVRRLFLTLVPVEGACPERVTGGLVGPLDKALAEELGTAVARVDPLLGA
jgi:hypothetical protein